MGRNALDAFRSRSTGAGVADVAETEDTDQLLPKSWPPVARGLLRSFCGFGKSALRFCFLGTRIAISSRIQH
jgi:hypothetical protein